MNRVREDFLPGASVAQEQDGKGSGGNLPGGLQELDSLWRCEDRAGLFRQHLWLPERVETLLVVILRFQRPSRIEQKSDSIEGKLCACSRARNHHEL